MKTVVALDAQVPTHCVMLTGAADAQSPIVISVATVLCAQAAVPRGTGNGKESISAFVCVDHFVCTAGITALSRPHRFDPKGVWPRASAYSLGSTQAFDTGSVILRVGVWSKFYGGVRLYCTLDCNLCTVMPRAMCLIQEEEKVSPQTGQHSPGTVFSTPCNQFKSCQDRKMWKTGIQAQNPIWQYFFVWSWTTCEFMEYRS